MKEGAGRKTIAKERKMKKRGWWKEQSVIGGREDSEKVREGKIRVVEKGRIRRGTGRKKTKEDVDSGWVDRVRSRGGRGRKAEKGRLKGK